ncbi:MAG: hypothetical protein RIQ60_3915 [Pseudomonadota bacterium]|jgi:hypothetical protein
MPQIAWNAPQIKAPRCKWFELRRKSFVTNISKNTDDFLSLKNNKTTQTPASEGWIERDCADKALLRDQSARRM